MAGDRDKSEAWRPMLATLADAPLQQPQLVYELKYDGIRAIVDVDLDVDVDVKLRVASVRLWSRLGNEKTAQFPEVAAAVAAWADRRGRGAVLDGEIVALDADGVPTGFQRLQDRIHLTQRRDIDRAVKAAPVALVLFDILADDGEDLRGRPLLERRQRLEAALAGEPPNMLRLSDLVVGDGRALYERAQAQGWEGLIVKGAASVYRSGQRSPEWRKLKLVRRQEFVVGGWTEPRRSRAQFGALLLGVPEAGGLRYVGHSGSGFTDVELQRVSGLLAQRGVRQCPFSVTPKTNERAHWVRPELVAEVKFSDWTDEGYLRHPIYLGLRDDVAPAAVRIEGPAAKPQVALGERAGDGRAEAHAGASAEGDADGDARALLDALAALEARGGGRLPLPDRGALDMTNLGKTLWPEPGITKGQLLRYYIAVAPYLLPVVQDRPLVMKRFPNGVDRPAFFQHRAPDAPPPGVRVQTIAGDDEAEARLVGGSLATLLYMAQLASLSQDPWFSRVQSIDEMDTIAIDLDPGEGVKFGQVADVARWVHDQLQALAVPSFPKTSGSRGVHVFVPMAPGTSYESGLLFAEMVATLVARAHPKQATVERTVGRRPRGTVYVDYLQNVRGKTLACAYSARASAFAGASTPLAWQELDGDIDPRDFTVLTLPARLRQVGDLWAELRRSPGADLLAVLENVQSAKSRNS